MSGEFRETLGKGSFEETVAILILELLLVIIISNLAIFIGR